MKTELSESRAMPQFVSITLTCDADAPNSDGAADKMRHPDVSEKIRPSFFFSRQRHRNETKKGNQGSVIIRKGSFRLVARIGNCLAPVAARNCATD